MSGKTEWQSNERVGERKRAARMLSPNFPICITPRARNLDFSWGGGGVQGVRIENEDTNL